MCKQGKDEAAEKQRIKEEKEKEDDAAANEEAKVSNVVHISCKLTQYALSIA